MLILVFARPNAPTAIRLLKPLEIYTARKGESQVYSLPSIPPDEVTMGGCSHFVVRGKADPFVLTWIERYKRAGGTAKFVLDNDDLLWGDNVPEWNQTHVSFNRQPEYVQMGERDWFRIMDAYTFSTPFLRDYALNEMGNEIGTKPVHLLPNSLSKSNFYGLPNNVSTDIRKPRVLYSGSNTHYNNETKMYGDWTEEVAAWVIEAVRNGEIEFHCMGGLPWFLEPVKDKIKVYPFVHYSLFPALLRSIKPHFSLNPLADHDFNRAKSDLKLVEAAAMNCVCVGTDFPGSPYKDCIVKLKPDMSRAQIDETIREFKDKGLFNVSLRTQRAWKDDNGRWMESQAWMDRMNKAYA